MILDTFAYISSSFRIHPARILLEFIYHSFHRDPLAPTRLSTQSMMR